MTQARAARRTPLDGTRTTDKQGSGLVRWATIEAVGNYRAKGNEKLRADYRRIAERRGKYKARVAVARKLLTLVFYALRDGEVRCLHTSAAA